MTARRALVCAPLPPEFDRESGSRRIFHLVEFLQEAGWVVTVLVQNEHLGSRHMRALRQRGVAAYGHGDRDLETIVTTGGFHLAIVAFWHLAAAYLPVIRAVSPSTRVVIDSIDVHFLRQARARLQTPGPRPFDDVFALEMAAELNAYIAADAVLTVSEKEAGLLNDFFSAGSSRPVHAVPDCEELAAVPEPFERRSGILFLGNFRHPPNVDALEYFAGDIAPRLDPATAGAHPVYVVGNGVTDAVARCAARIPNVRLVGWVPDVIPYFARARVCIAPLRYGAGTKRKLIQSLMLGTPCVTTSTGAEGLGLQPDQHAVVADDADAFARGIERLLRDGRVWEQLSSAGRARMAAVHGRASVKQTFLGVIEAVLAAPRTLPAAAAAAPAIDAQRDYHELVTRIHGIVESTVPAEATVVVVSRGDERLVRMAARRAWHFPRNGAGGYAGCYPADAAAAVAHLETLRAEGADFLLFPSTAFWWLEHYADLKRHLDTTADLVSSTGDCVVYRLTRATAASAD